MIGLSFEERQLFEKLEECAEDFSDLDHAGAIDCEDFSTAIRNAQNVVLARPMTRAIIECSFGEDDSDNE